MNVDRDVFPKDDNLSKVTPDAYVKHLRAIVSNHPCALEPIEPILDFDLSKFSFVKGLDAVATLDSRPDLMQMSPTYFEHLVQQIFEAQGAEGWTTQESRDDGVDAVIVQAKRWFARGCHAKAREHGRMEPIDGEKLTYLIKEYLGKDVLIGIPYRPRTTAGNVE